MRAIGELCQSVSITTTTTFDRFAEWKGPASRVVDDLRGRGDGGRRRKSESNGSSEADGEEDSLNE